MLPNHSDDGLCAILCQLLDQTVYSYFSSPYAGVPQWSAADDLPSFSFCYFGIFYFFFVCRNLKLGNTAKADPFWVEDLIKQKS